MANENGGEEQVNRAAEKLLGGQSSGSKILFSRDHYYVLLFLQQLVQLIHKGTDVLELTVDGGEADIGDLVHILQFFHDQLTDFGRGDLALHLILESLLNVIGDFFQCSHGNRALLTGLQHTAQQLALIKGLTVSVTLDDHQRQTFHGLIGGEALVALQTLTAAANAAALLGGTGVYDLAFKMGTIGTFHS